MGSKDPILTAFQKKLAEVMALLDARLEDDQTLRENIEQHASDPDPASRVGGYLSSAELKPPE